MFWNGSLCPDYTGTVSIAFVIVWWYITLSAIVHKTKMTKESAKWAKKVRTNAWRGWKARPLSFLAYGVLPWVIGWAITLLAVRNDWGWLVPAALPLCVILSMPQLINTLLTRRPAQDAIAPWSPAWVNRCLLVMVPLLALIIGLMALFMGDKSNAIDQILVSDRALIFTFIGLWVPGMVAGFCVLFVAMISGAQGQDLLAVQDSLPEAWDKTMSFSQVSLLYLAVAIAAGLNLFIPFALVLTVAVIHCHLVAVATMVHHEVARHTVANRGDDQ